MTGSPHREIHGIAAPPARVGCFEIGAYPCRVRAGIRERAQDEAVRRQVRRFLLRRDFPPSCGELQRSDSEYKLARRESESRARRCRIPVRNESAVALASLGLK